LTKIRACLIGCGDIGYGFDRHRVGYGALTHFKALMESERFELCGIAEKKNESREEISQKFGIRAYEDFEDMLEEQKPEVLVIASNDETHIPILNIALKHKPRLVFCEKPLGLNQVEVINILGEYENAGVMLQVNYTRRFLQEFHNIKQKIDSGEIGRISSVTFYYSRGLVHNASHYLDLVNWYFGTPDKVTTLSEREGLGEHDKSYTFGLSYTGGVEIIFIGLDSSKLSFAEIDIAGSDGRIKFNYRNEIEYYRVVENPNYRGFQIYELTETAPVRFEYALQNAYENIFDCLTKGTALSCSGSESKKLFETINRIKNQ
jgi:predicted dehydrogenase